MKRTLAALIGGLVSTSAFAHAVLEDCLKAAKQKHEGEFVKVEYLSKTIKGVPTYEIELRESKGGVEHEFLCDAGSGKIYEIGREVANASDESFQKKAKVSEKDAIATATKKHKGEVFAVEYEIGSNGNPSYEIDIREGQKEHKIEIDAVTGKIMQDATEEWQIGQETGERYRGSQGVSTRKADPSTTNRQADETRSKDAPRDVPGKGPAQ
jgi:uncharacterized membrane protein YkoI